MARAGTRRAGALTGLLFLAIAVHAQENVLPRSDERLQVLRGEITRLEGELQDLQHRERGLLGELERLGAEVRLRDKQYEEVSARLEGVSAEIDDHDATLARLDQAQHQRRRYLAFRLREIYKAGSDQWLQRVLGGDAVEDYWQGLSYASFLSERDAEVLVEFRTDAELAIRERQELEQAREAVITIQEELGRGRDVLEATRRKRSAALGRIREDQQQRQTALAELQAAAQELSGLVDTLSADRPSPTLDMHKFKGLLEWPGSGSVVAGFGTVVHPKFQTEVPHPGWDIEAPFGSDISTVFGGQVVFADWMRGYGLTAIVDHGGGVLSIYAHASVLLVQSGETVTTGQTLGLVGDTGSLRGPYLYFELRVDGRPVDPRTWLRER